jgi:hypothetical protein
MSPRRVTFALLFLLLALILASAAAWADSHARIVRLSYVEGDVQIDRGDGQGFQPAFLNLPITQGSRLLTHDDGRAEIEFEDGSTLRIVPDTNVVFDQMGLRDSGAKFTSVNLQQGTAYFDLRRKDKKEEFTISAGGQQRLELHHSARFRVDVDPTGLKLAVFDGEVQFDGPGKSVAVKKNETLDTDRTDRFYTSKNITPEPYDSWMKEREQYRKQYSNNSSYNLSSSLYGQTDLNYYGNFFNSPYGYVWRPWYASAAWDPFLDGAWVFYPGFGYNWVSAHPWGWLPYHYGSWVYFQPYGWCWRPGRVWNNWSPVAVIGNPRPGFVPPRPPTTPPARGNGGVVVVGRGPNPGIVHNPRLEDRNPSGQQTLMPRSSPLLKWPSPTVRMPAGSDVSRGLANRRPEGNGGRAPDNTSIYPLSPSITPLHPSTLAPLRPTGPSAPIVPHFPPPVPTQPRIPSSPPRIMSSPSPHMMSAPSIHTSAPHSSRR